MDCPLDDVVASDLRLVRVSRGMPVSIASVSYQNRKCECVGGTSKRSPGFIALRNLHPLIELFIFCLLG